jgi:GNAT superfamily N-acetyltransferase
MAVRQATTADVAEIVDILADGFADDPMFVWMFAGDESSLRAWLELVAETALEKGPAHIADGACAVLWIPSGDQILGARERELVAELLERELGERGAEVLAALREIGSHRPEGPSAHLLYIATRRGRRGEGLGAEVTAPGLAECDRNGWPAYLNSTSTRNHPFYRRIGFERITKVEPGAGAPPIYPMWREPG